VAVGVSLLFGTRYLSEFMPFGGRLCDWAMCLRDMLGQPRGETYAGVVADALAYYGLECEFAFVKHGDDGGQDVASRVLFVEWRFGATWVAYVIG
jgi:hypothetical protein